MPFALPIRLDPIWTKSAEGAKVRVTGVKPTFTTRGEGLTTAPKEFAVPAKLEFVAHFTSSVRDHPDPVEVTLGKLEGELTSWGSSGARSASAKAALGLGTVADARTGAVAAVQRTDGALRLNVHCHVLALDAVYIHDKPTAARAVPRRAGPRRLLRRGYCRPQASPGLSAHPDNAPVAAQGSGPSLFSQFECPLRADAETGLYYTLQKVLNDFDEFYREWLPAQVRAGKYKKLVGEMPVAKASYESERENVNACK